MDGTCATAFDGPDSGADSSTPDANLGVDVEGLSCSTLLFCGDPPVCCEGGTECIEGACIPTCETGVRCGGACCGNASDVCINDTCAAPGEACGDNFDCPEGQFCEPTRGACFPQFMPLTCEREPVYGRFEVTTEYEFTESAQRPDCVQAISTPIVVDLDGDGTPELIAVTHCNSAYTEGALRVLRGDTGEEVWTSEVAMNGRAGIAAGDLDGTGEITIIGLTSPTDSGGARRIIAFDADGNERWRSRDAIGHARAIQSENGAPTLADLDGDGRSEIIWGGMAFGSDGRLIWSAGEGDSEGTNNGYPGGIALVADIDMDGLMDVVTGRRAWERDGTPKWSRIAAGDPDGYPAIGQFDGDPQPEIVLVASGNVSLLDGITGRVQWGPVAIPGGGRGGPPVVADFDGDGAPEIGVAGGVSYTVYDPSTRVGILWSATTIDGSSNATGSSVFDFEGDGTAEVVYQDECHVWVYSGVDGSVLLSIDNSSATVHEYPIVVDVDGDGNSELVVVANDRGGSSQCGTPFTGRRHGIFVYGDSRDQWVPTRPVWNQHAYSVTNVGTAGEIPLVARSNWEVEGLNNFRQNAQGEGIFNAPDLQVGLEVRLDRCATDQATLRARVTNRGNLGVRPGVNVMFYEGLDAAAGSEIASVATTTSLLPGASEIVELVVDLPEVSGGADFSVHVDRNTDSFEAVRSVGSVRECDEENNTANLSGVECDLLI